MPSLVSESYYFIRLRLSKRQLVKSSNGYHPPSRYLENRRQIAGKIWVSEVLLSGIRRLGHCIQKQGISRRVVHAVAEDDR